MINFYRLIVPIILTSYIMMHFHLKLSPEMWTEENFIKAHYLLNKNGFLITFCAKGEVKRILKKVGFNLSHPSGPFGKREITLAIKN